MEVERAYPVPRWDGSVSPADRQDRRQVEGEGQWNACQHGRPERRLWGKIHIVIDQEPQEVGAGEVTGSNIGDAPFLTDLLYQKSADEHIASVTADYAHDTCKCHEAIAARGAAAVIPPRKNARP